MSTRSEELAAIVEANEPMDDATVARLLREGKLTKQEARLFSDGFNSPSNFETVED